MGVEGRREGAGKPAMKLGKGLCEGGPSEYGRAVRSGGGLGLGDSLWWWRWTNKEVSCCPLDGGLGDAVKYADLRGIHSCRTLKHPNHGRNEQCS